MTEVEIVEQVLCRPDGDRRVEGLLEDPRLRDLLPELYRLDGVPQDPRYHPEGDVLVHTLRAVRLLPTEPERRLAWAVLLHDLGKAETTREIDGRLRALGHDRRGAELAEEVLRRLGMPPQPRDDIVWLIRHHMFPLTVRPPRPPAARRHRRPAFSALARPGGDRRPGRRPQSPAAGAGGSLPAAAGPKGRERR